MSTTSTNSMWCPGHPELLEGASSENCRVHPWGGAQLGLEQSCRRNQQYRQGRGPKFALRDYPQ